MKNPFFMWFVMKATSITPTTPAAAIGVKRPRTRAAPAATSTRLAIQACRMPGFMPSDSNQRAVPAILPPP